MTTDGAFVLGLDGVPWDRLSDWIDAGELPNFARLRAEGVSGPLESTIPPTTALAWPSIATGVWPDKHGVYAFQRLAGDYSQRMATSADVSRPALWDMVSPAVVGNVPMTYPADDIDGEMVTGMMTPEQNEQFTHPTELKAAIDERIPDYEIGLTWSDYGDRPDAFRTELDGLLSARRSLMDLMLERTDPRLTFFVYTSPDRLQHLLWEDDVMLEHYQRLDEILGDVLGYTERYGQTLFVVSDHGFGPISKNVAVNTALERAGLLTRRESTGTRSLFSRVGIQRDTVLAALERVGIDQQTLVQVLPKSLVDSVAQQVPGTHVLYDVAYDETKAFVHGPGCVYVNDTERFDQGTVAPEDRKGVAKQVRAVLADVTDPETGKRVLRVFDGDDLFETDEASPDLVVRPKDGYQKITGLTDSLFEEPESATATHRPEGIFFARGPGIEAGGSVSGATVVDVAPTVLHSIGEPLPADADGQVLDVFAPDSVPAQTPIAEQSYQSAVDATADDGNADETDEQEEDFDDVEERLRGLGYME